MSETTYPEAGFANRTLADIAATLPGVDRRISPPQARFLLWRAGAVGPGRRRPGIGAGTGWKPSLTPSWPSVCRPSTRSAPKT